MKNPHIPKHLFPDIAIRMDQVLKQHQNTESHQMIISALAHGKCWVARDVCGGVLNDFQEPVKI